MLAFFAIFAGSISAITYMKKIVIASDSFKGSLSSKEVSEAVTKGIRCIYPSCETVSLVLGDGGESTCEAIAGTMPCKWVQIRTQDPLGRGCTARYAICEDASGPVAVIELAQSSGLTLLSADELDPLRTSTFGTGLMIIDALEKGCRKFIIGLGGSATNDGGTGMMEALGVRFMDDAGHPINGCCGKKLEKIAHIDTSQMLQALKESSFTAACDVDTTFYGESGATHIFAPQKGASERDIEILERGMKSFSDIILREFGISLGSVNGSGAAGGAGGALQVLLGAKLIKGAELMLDIIRFDEIIEDADLVITGEGRIDSQTFSGKLPSTVLHRASSKGVPVLAICGIVELTESEIRDSGFLSIIPVRPRPSTPDELAEAMNPSSASHNISESLSRFFSQDL